MDMDERLSPETPKDSLRLRISKPKKSAAGIPAALSSMNHGIRKMGLIKTARTLTMVNQQAGFDCPGCAWPDPSHRTTFEFCENGAKAVADEAMKAKVNPEFFEKYSVDDLVGKSDHWLNKQGRISHPMVLRPGATHYSKISWDDAFSFIGSAIKDLDDPEQAVFYTSGRTSNEAAFLYQAYVRSLGTNNMPDCSNMCHESSGKGLGQTIGIGKGTVSLDDFNHADVILVIGQNPGTNHPRMLTALRDAKHKGAQIIHINPLPEAGLERFKHPQDYMQLNFKSTRLSDHHLQVKIGGDAALMKGFIKVHLEKGGIDHAFIKSSTTGYESMCARAKATSWKDIVRDSGLDRKEIESVGSILASSRGTIACWAMGLTQQPNGVAVIQEVVNLLLMGGHVGKPGAGFCPVRGHSNVQGDRTVGIWEAPSESFLQQMEQGLGIPMPRKHGYDVVNAIRAMNEEKVGVFFCMGGNFLSATPDTNQTARGLAKIDLTVQVSTKLNRSHLFTGKTALILPCLGRTELDKQTSGDQFVTVENSMGVVHRSTGGLAPASPHLLSEPAIVARLAQSSLVHSPLDWEGLASNYDGIRDLMAQSLAGFEGYNTRVRQDNGFNLPNPPKDSRSFSTPDGKALFTSHELPDVNVPDSCYVMMTIRSHDQYNTTIYDVHDRYRGIHGNRRVVLMNANDMAQRGWKSRQKVRLTSHFQGVDRVSENWQLVAYDIPSGNIATYFPESNSLVPLDSTAAVSNTPTSKWIIVSIDDSAGPNRVHEEE